MAIVDIIIIAIVLIAAIIGTCKGFVKSLLGFFGWIIAIVLAVTLSAPTDALLTDKTPLDDKIQTSLESTVTGWSDYMSVELTEENYSEVINSALSETKLPEFVKTPIAGAIDGLVESNRDTVIGNTAAGIISSTLANLAVTIIAFLIIFIIAMIIIAVIKHLLCKAIEKISVIKKIDKALGFVFGAIEGAVIVCLLLGVVSFTNSMGLLPQAGEFVNNGSIAPKIYEFVEKIMEQYVHINVSAEV